MTGPQPLVAPPHEQRASVPNGWLGACYGSWPLLAFAGFVVSQSGWRAAAVDEFLWGSLALGIARACLWTVRRRRNRVDVTGSHVHLVSEGKPADFQASDIHALNWYYGHWTPTWSPTAFYAAFSVTLTDGRHFYVELLLPRWRDQRRAFQRLADAFPPVDWTVRWPHSVIPKRDRVWNRAQGRVPR